MNIRQNANMLGGKNALMHLPGTWSTSLLEKCCINSHAESNAYQAAFCQPKRAQDRTFPGVLRNFLGLSMSITEIMLT